MGRFPISTALRHLSLWSLLLGSCGFTETCRAGEKGPPWWADRSAKVESGSSWLSPDWSFRIRLAVAQDSIVGSEPFVGFPLLLPMNGDDLPGVFDHAAENGMDIVITKSDGVTPLPREVVSYDALLRKAEVWFRADTLSAAAHSFYLYYGNQDTAITNVSGAVWDQSHLSVYHFSEPPNQGILRDWGAHSNHALPRGGWTQADTIGGAIGQGWRFNGTTHWIDGDAVSSTDSTFTISAWFADWDRFSGGGDFAFHVEVGYWHLSVKRNEAQPRADYARNGGTISWYPDLPDEQLHHFVWILDGVADTARFFFDGDEQAIRMRYAPNPPYRVYTGNQILGNVGIAGQAYGGGTDAFHGIADEFRILAGVRSPSWVKTEYRNQKSGIAFFVVEQEEISGLDSGDPHRGDRGLLVVRPNPSRGGVIIALPPEAVGAGHLEILNLTGRFVTRLDFPSPLGKHMSLRWDGVDSDGRLVGPGVYFLRTTKCEPKLRGKVLLLR